MNLKTMASSSDLRRGYTPPVDAKERVFVRHIADLVQAHRRSGSPRFSQFCNEREQELAEAALSSCGGAEHFWDGGYDGAQRRMLCISDGASRPAPLCRLAVRLLGEGASLTHRDYLGALMGLRIARECIGDILCSDGGAQIVVSDTVAALVLDELREVGSRGVEVSKIDVVVPGEENCRQEHTATLPSLRLDALLAVMLRVSRSEAVRRISSGGVLINHVQKCAPDEPVYAGDVFSIRGSGKYELVRVGEKSRKGRIFVTYTEY